MKKSRIAFAVLLSAIVALFVGAVLASCASTSALAEDDRPEWVDEWRRLYPDSTYIAQLGKATGKKNAARAKTVAANTVAQYIQTNVQSELSSHTKTTTASNKNGALVTTSEQQNVQNITLSVDFAVTSLEFTDPWYNKAEKTWYCVAYVEREKVWLQYQPKLQDARDRLFAFYGAAEKSGEPLYRMLIYMQAQDYEADFFTAYSFAQILSPPLTQAHYQKDAAEVSNTTAKSMEEKNKCTFLLRVKNDSQSIVYQRIKDALSNEGFVVKNGGESALYTVNAIVDYGDSPSGDVHVLRPSFELSIIGKTMPIFSYAKQSANISGLGEAIVKQKAARAIADEIGRTFISEFNEKLNVTAKDDLSKLMGL